MEQRLLHILDQKYGILLLAKLDNGYHVIVPADSEKFMWIALVLLGVIY